MSLAVIPMLPKFPLACASPPPRQKVHVGGMVSGCWLEENKFLHQHWWHSMQSMHTLPNVLQGQFLQSPLVLHQKQTSLLYTYYGKQVSHMPQCASYAGACFYHLSSYRTPNTYTIIDVNVFSPYNSVLYIYKLKIFFPLLYHVGNSTKLLRREQMHFSRLTTL